MLLPDANIILTLNSGAYKVLKVGAANLTHREKKTFEKIKLAAAHSEHRGSICVRRPESVLDFDREGQTYNCFVFAPLGPNLLEYITRSYWSSGQPFGSPNTRFVAAYLLYALDFLHANGIAHTGEPISI